MSSERVLDPVERVGEVLFGTIMALTFTGSLSAAEAGREEVRELLIAAIGCNVAWGVIDAVMYLMGCLSERAAAARAATAFRAAPDAAEARAVVRDALPPTVAAALGDAEVDVLRVALAERLPTVRPGLTARDWRGALGVFLLVTVATFPIVVPFLVVRDAIPALRVSNAIALAMLFGLGTTYGRAIGVRPWLVGVAMLGLGVVLVAITIALGG
jgi:VIT1/CCC1 family predicted Fe2+/Mn2+ transporter